MRVNYSPLVTGLLLVLSLCVRASCTETLDLLTRFNVTLPSERHTHTHIHATSHSHTHENEPALQVQDGRRVCAAASPCVNVCVCVWMCVCVRVCMCVTGGQDVRALDAVLPIWLERASDVHGRYHMALVITALGTLLESNSPHLQTIQVSNA